MTYPLNNIIIKVDLLGRCVDFRHNLQGVHKTDISLLETFSSRDVDVNVERKRSLTYVA